MLSADSAKASHPLSEAQIEEISISWHLKFLMALSMKGQACFGSLITPSPRF
jgi:hypothetical protein